jgi:cyclohexyl-isocyanide hydratase
MTLQFGLLVFPRVQQLDLTGPYEVFASVPDAKVHLIWKDRSPVTSVTGLALTPTTTLAECPKLDVLCVPGGAGINPLLQDEEVLDFLRAQAAQVRYLSSVCTGALVLGAAGLLKGRRATRIGTRTISLRSLAPFRRKGVLCAMATCSRRVASRLASISG